MPLKYFLVLNEIAQFQMEVLDTFKIQGERYLHKAYLPTTLGRDRDENIHEHEKSALKEPLEIL